jgi:hypothetical protein
MNINQLRKIINAVVLTAQTDASNDFHNNDGQTPAPEGLPNEPELYTLYADVYNETWRALREQLVSNKEIDIGLVNLRSRQYDNLTETSFNRTFKPFKHKTAVGE